MDQIIQNVKNIFEKEIVDILQFINRMILRNCRMTPEVLKTL
jgi:hypothetical protein